MSENLFSFKRLPFRSESFVPLHKSSGHVSVGAADGIAIRLDVRLGSLLLLATPLVVVISFIKRTI